MKNIVILHIGYVDSNKASGVNVAIPKMVHAQHKYANTLLLNLSNEYSDELSVSYLQYACIQSLPSPFNKPTIVIFHEIYRKPFIKLSRECMRANIPYIIIPHGGLTERAQRIKAYKKIPANLLIFVISSGMRHQSSIYRIVSAMHLLLRKSHLYAEMAFQYQISHIYLEQILVYECYS